MLGLLPSFLVAETKESFVHTTGEITSGTIKTALRSSDSCVLRFVYTLQFVPAAEHLWRWATQIFRQVNSLLAPPFVP